MLIKFNGPSGAPTSPTTCAAITEKSDNAIQLATQDLKDQVGYYGHVMKNEFSVTPVAFFAQVPVSLQLLQDFITKNNSPAGVRVYFAKKTNDPLVGDYEMVFVPCGIVTESDGSQYFEDMGLKATAANAFTMTIECRKPPGCDKGALLL